MKKYGHKTEEELIAEIQEMDDKRAESERNLLFKLAEEIRLEIAEMKSVLDKKKMLAIADSHALERNKVEADKLRKTIEHEEFWNVKIRDAEESTAKTLEKLHAKHAEDMEVYERQLRQEIPLKGKKSAAVLNAEEMMKGLAAKQKYKEAEMLLEQIRSRQAKDDQEYQIEREKKIQNLLSKRRAQQENELRATELKIQAVRDAILASREEAFANLHNKASSFSKNLENQQMNEYIEFEKDVRAENQSTKIWRSSDYSHLIRDPAKAGRLCILK